MSLIVLFLCLACLVADVTSFCSLWCLLCLGMACLMLNIDAVWGFGVFFVWVFFFYLEIGICCFFGYQEFGLLGGMKPIRCLDISLDVKGYP